MLERDLKKTRFYLHFGAGFLVWFVYLPLVSVVCTYVSSLWRYKTIISEFANEYIEPVQHVCTVMYIICSLSYDR